MSSIVKSKKLGGCLTRYTRIRIMFDRCSKPTNNNINMIFRGQYINQNTIDVLFDFEPTAALLYYNIVYYIKLLFIFLNCIVVQRRSLYYVLVLKGRTPSPTLLMLCVTRDVCGENTRIKSSRVHYTPRDKHDYTLPTCVLTPQNNNNNNIKCMA